jgi:hypothetical protein
MRPNLVIVGVHKCGTTALHHYLGLHPEIFMAEPKELNFFVEELNWGRGTSWYEARFEGAGDSTVVGEASPSYANHPKFEGVPARMHSVVPEAKLIFMVRDPVDRILSHHRMERARGAEQRPLTESGLRHLETRMVRQSMYWLQLRQFLVYYPISRILVLSQEELLTDRPETLRRAFRFVGVDPSFEDAEFGELRNTSDEREISSLGERRGPEELEDAPLRKLIAHLRPDIDEFRRHVGREFPNWCV